MLLKLTINIEWEILHKIENKMFAIFWNKTFPRQVIVLNWRL